VIWLHLERADRFEQRSRRTVHAALRPSSALEKIRSADVADKNKIASESTERILAALQVGHEEGQMLWSMTGSMRNPKTNPTYVDPRAITKYCRALERPIGINPLTGSLSRKMENSARRIGQRARPRNKVGVDVRLRHVCDPDAIGTRRANVLPSVRIGVDDDRFARLFARDQVARLGQILVVKSSEKHGPFEAGGEALLDERTVVSVLLTNSMTDCAIYHQREY
jgi:hypothetical protein